MVCSKNIKYLFPFYSSRDWMIFLLFVLFPAAMAGPDEKRLIETLLHDYNPIERPVANESDTVPLKFGI